VNVLTNVPPAAPHSACRDLGSSAGVVVASAVDLEPGSRDVAR